MKNLFIFILLFSAFSCSKIKEKVNRIAPKNQKHSNIEYKIDRDFLKQEINEIIDFEKCNIMKSYSSKEYENTIYSIHIDIINPKININDNLFLSLSKRIRRVASSSISNYDKFNTLTIKFKNATHNRNIEKVSYHKITYNTH